MDVYRPRLTFLWGRRGDLGAHFSQVADSGHDRTVFFETTLTLNRIAEMNEKGLWSNEHFYDRFSVQVAERSSQALVIDGDGALSWREGFEQVEQLSKGLLELGVRSGDVVQLQLPNRREFLLCVLAIERIGAVVNPVAPIFRSNEVRVMSELAKPRVVITVDSFRGFGLGAMHAELREASPWLEHLVIIPTSSDAGASLPDTSSWAEVMTLGAESNLSEHALDLTRPGSDDVCEVMFTSGTTGQPKGVMHTQNTLNVAADLWLERVASDCSVFHMASTLAHQTGYLYGVRAPIFAGGTVVYQEAWNAEEFADLIEANGIEASMGATPFLADLLAVPNLAERNLSSFKAFVCAGAAIPRPVLEQAKDALSCTVLPGWGMTETGLSTMGRRDDSFEKRCTDGIPIPGNEVRVVDEDGHSVPPGEEGDLQFRGSETFVGYLQGRDLTESCFRDGWFDTGDRAVLDADGYVSISGRTKDIVIRGGENIPVKEVEDVLLRHPDVVNVAVVAKSHDRLGEVGCAVVLPGASEPTLSELVDFLDSQGVTKQFWPEALVIVEGFPMTPSGKIQKYQLRKLIEG